MRAGVATASSSVRRGDSIDRETRLPTTWVKLRSPWVVRGGQEVVSISTGGGCSGYSSGGPGAVTGDHPGPDHKLWKGHVRMSAG